MDGHCFLPWPPSLTLEPNSSDDFGRNAKRSSGFRMGASPYMKQQWAHMHHVSEATATTPAAEEDIDHRPSWEPTPPTVKREWSKTISRMKRKAKEAAHFRASEFPSSLLHVEADLKGKKPFILDDSDKCGGRLWPGARPMRRVGLLFVRQRLRTYGAPQLCHLR
jgi:hypothetical protein